MYKLSILRASKYRVALLASILTVGLASVTTAAYSQDDSNSAEPVTIGVISDMSGFFSDSTGIGTVVAAEMAVDDYGGSILGRKINIISGDHQHKADVGSGIARRWIDKEKVDLITGIDNSAVALAVQGLASEAGVISISTGAGAETLTEEQCARYGIHYVYDTYALATGLVRTLYQAGADSWFIVGSDYAFGRAMAKTAEQELDALGGKMLGAVFAPFNSQDFASFVLQAQSSKAKVIGFANAGSETVNAIKASESFGLVQSGQELAGFLVTLPDVRVMGLSAAQGLQFVTAFYWDRTAESREWSKRFFEKRKAMPTMMQAGVYSAVTTYLKAVEKAGTLDSDEVRAALGEVDINDFFVTNGKILPNGLMLHDMYLGKVKSPEASDSDWDLLTIEKTIPASEAFRPLSESQCKLLKAS